MALAGLNIGFIALGSLSMLMVARTILNIDKILSTGDYSNAPPLKWAVGVGLLMVTMIPVMIIAGVGFVAIALGALSMMIVAKTIVIISKTISKGTYTGGPTKDWAMGVGISLVAFSTSMILLGMFGILGVPMLIFGAAMLLIVAQTIASVGGILNKGIYTGGPKKEWAEGVGIAINAFATTFNSVKGTGTSLWQKMFGGGSSTKDFVNFIETVSEGIKAAALTLNDEKIYVNGPTKRLGRGCSNCNYCIC